jgi:hypothetical protein
MVSAETLIKKRKTSSRLIEGACRSLLRIAAVSISRGEKPYKNPTANVIEAIILL